MVPKEMSRQEHLFSLRHADLFHDLAELDVSEVLDHSTWVSYDRGELIASPAELAVTVLVIVGGCACLYRVSGLGQLLTMATFRPGTACSLLVEVIGLQPKSMLQATDQDTTVCRIPAECLRSMIHVRKELAARALQITTVLLAEAYDRLEDLGLHDVRTRLAHTVARLALADEQHMVGLTHQELAWMVGSTREKVTDGLHYLRRGGLVTFTHHHHGIRVLDPDRLLSMDSVERD